MSAGSFSAALTALKAGEFVRRIQWKNEFLVLMGPNTVPADQIADEKLRAIMAEAEAPGVYDFGNIRKFNMTAQTVENGWTPTWEDIFAVDWITYSLDDIALAKLEWELFHALERPGDITKGSLAGILGNQ